MKKYDICILGGGASGMAAAALVSERFKTCILEKNKILGRKLMATGGGRCNITNIACRHKDVTVDFFRSLGIELYSDEEGRFYPYSNQAQDVVYALENKIRNNFVDIYTELCIKEVLKTKDGFRISDGKNIFLSDILILACGGKAAPVFGATGDGYRFAKSLGHNINKVYPILTGIECEGVEGLKGIRAKGRITLLKDGRIIASDKGEIQFTGDGISGICVMNMTLFIKAEKGENIHDAIGRYEICLDLAPDFTNEMLSERKSSFGILSKRLSERVSIDKIKDFRLKVTGVKGWKNAQCTAGGIPKEEIKTYTMESKITENLYLTGEIIDAQGKCGGFNLQNAWETAIKAATDINSGSKNGGSK